MIPMGNMQVNLPHIIMAIVVIASMTVLAALHIITGAEAIGVIGASGGFSLGAGGASASLFSAQPPTAVISDSGSSGTGTTVQIVPPAPPTGETHQQTAG